MLAGRASKCPFALLLRHHCPLPAALVQSKSCSAPQLVHSPSADCPADTQQQQQQAHTQQAAGLVHQPAQLGQVSAEHMPSPETNSVPSADVLTGSIQRGDQGMGVTSSEEDASLGTPDTSPCSMEAHPMGSAGGCASASDHPGGHDAGLITAEPMTQDLVIADSDTEDDGQPQACVQISVDGVTAADNLVNGQLLSPASDGCNTWTLQLNLSPDACPSPSRAACTAGPAAGLATEAASIKAPALAVNAGAYSADGMQHLQLLIRPEPDPTSHAAEVSVSAHDDAPMSDTLPDSCPDACGGPGAAIAPCHPTAAKHTNCRPEQDTRVPSEARLPALSEAYVTGPSAAVTAPSCATAASIQTAVATAHTSGEAAVAVAKVTTLAAAIEASAGTAAAALAAAGLAAAGDHASEGAGDGAQNAAGGAAQSTVSKHEKRAGEALNSDDPGQLQQLLLQSHVPHAAVTAFLWSAVRHIVPQVCVALHHTDHLLGSHVCKDQTHIYIECCTSH